MVMDKLVGPKVRICVTKFLPTIFVDAMKQSPEAAISMLDSQVKRQSAVTLSSCHNIRGCHEAES
jgi:hypothetical protein